MDFPAWAPSEAIEYWKLETAQHQEMLDRFAKSEAASGRIVPPELLNEADPSLEMLYRLLSHADMKFAWEEVQKHNIDPMLVIYSCALGYIGPIGLQTWPTKQRAAKVGRIRDLARELADLVRHTEYEEMLLPQWRQVRTRVRAEQALHAGLTGAPTPKDQTGRFMPPPISRILDQIALFDPSEHWDIDTPRPRSDEAPMHLFVRRLDALFQKQASVRLRATVLRFVNVAFEKDLDERQLYRIAP